MCRLPDADRRSRSDPRRRRRARTAHAVEGRVGAHPARSSPPSPRSRRPRPNGARAKPKPRRAATHWNWPVLAMAASLLIALVAGLAATSSISRARRAPRRTPPAPGNATSGELVQSIENELDQAAAHYEKAIAGLEQVANASDSPLDPELMTTLKANLGVIDQAINESRTALQSAAGEPAGAGKPVRGVPPQGLAAAGHDRADERDAQRESGRRRPRRGEPEQIIDMTTISTLVTGWLIGAAAAAAAAPLPSYDVLGDRVATERAYRSVAFVPPAGRKEKDKEKKRREQGHARERRRSRRKPRARSASAQRERWRTQVQRTAGSRPRPARAPAARVGRNRRRARRQNLLRRQGRQPAAAQHVRRRGDHRRAAAPKSRWKRSSARRDARTREKRASSSTTSCSRCRKRAADASTSASSRAAANRAPQ